MDDVNPIIQEALFTLEEEESSCNNIVDGKTVPFNFNDFMEDIVLVEPEKHYEQSRITIINGKTEKRLACPHPDCSKSYTSNHGLKYHLKHGHKKSKEQVEKPFVCPISSCPKTYRNSNGLKYHINKSHGNCQ